MTDPAYLEEAAALLRAARDDNEKRAETAADLKAATLPFMDVLAEVNARRLEIAQCFTALAAIERGVANVTLDYPVPGPEAQ